MNANERRYYEVALVELEKANQQLKALRQMKDVNEWGPQIVQNGHLRIQLILAEQRAEKLDKLIQHFLTAWENDTPDEYSLSISLAIDAFIDAVGKPHNE